MFTGTAFRKLIFLKMLLRLARAYANRLRDD
jgi:hypothetical protein